MAEKIELEEDFSEFYLNIQQNETQENQENQEKITVPVSGKHFVYNALCAASVGKLLRDFN